jgi:hypothetical protein
MGGERRSGQARIWEEADGRHIDVRGLPPPEPMLAILRLLADCGPETTVTVHHDREPIYLYPELAEIGWHHEVVEAPAGEVQLRLTRAPGP